MGGTLQNAPQGTLLVGLLIALFVAEAVGRRIGTSHRKYGGTDVSQQVGALEAAVLGLLALLLGFTFSMAAERFSARRELTRQEANAIGTALLRSELISQPEAGALKSLLTRYVDLRVDFYNAGDDAAKLAAVNSKVERMHAEMWRHVVNAVQHDARPTTALLVAAMNDVFDMHSSRVAALYNHVPEPVLWFLLMVSVLSAGIAGYASGVSNVRYWPSTAIVILLIASATLVIVDLDRPRRGLIRAGQPAMLDLQRSLKQAAQ